MNEMYTRETELFHHGIKGQRWGVRRFQYENGSLTPEGVVRYRKGGKNGKTEMGGLATIALDLAINSTIKAVRKNKNNKAIQKSQKEKDAGMKPDLKTKHAENMADPPEGIDSAMKNINRFGGNVNCFYCSTAYEINRRGYKISAPGTQQGVTEMEGFSKMYTNYRPENTRAIVKMSDYKPMSFKKEDKAYNLLKNSILKDGGKRGTIGFTWDKGGGGHAIAYEVTSSGVCYIDAQSGKKYDEKQIKKMTKHCVPHMSTYTRTDNLKINNKYISETFNRG